MPANGNNAAIHQQARPPRRWPTFAGHKGLKMERPPYTTVEFLLAMDAKIGSKPTQKVLILLDSGPLDISSKYEGGAVVELIKETAPDQISSGDMVLTFANDDDTFTELDSSSDFYQTVYHNKRIQFYAGFSLPDGSKEYALQATMLITAIEFSSADSKVFLSCQDLGTRLLDETINGKPSTIIPEAGASNTGNGVCSDIAIKPFGTVAESWTLTCTLGGGDATATFSVVGSVSGNIGTATSGAEFTTGSKIKFTISAGGTNWVATDTFTFSTPQMMEFNLVSPIKIMWSILTGTNWDTGASEAWSARTPQFSSVRSGANPDIDVSAFSRAVDAGTFTMKGYVEWDASLIETLQEIALHFLGSVFVNEAGQVSVEWFVPTFGVDQQRTFSDSKKNFSFLYRRRMEDMINDASCKYKKRDSWDWDDADFEYDGFYVNSDSTSNSSYRRMAQNYTSRWYSANGAHVEFFIDRLIDRFSSPPFIAEFETGSDAFLVKLGDRIKVTDTKANISNQQAEVTRMRKSFEELPRSIEIQAIFEETMMWAFMGSAANEGDSLSPQEENYYDSDSNDRRFAYMGTSDTTIYEYDNTVAYGATALPQNAPSAWTRALSVGVTVNTEAVAAGVLTIDITRVGGEGYLQYYQDTGSDWDNNASAALGKAGAGIEMKSTNFGNMADSPEGSYLSLEINTPDRKYAVLLIFNDGITLRTATDQDYTVDTTSYHTYVIRMKDADTVEVLVDDVVAITGTPKASTTGSTNSVIIQLTISSAGGSNITADVKRWWYNTTNIDYFRAPNYRMF